MQADYWPLDPTQILDRIDENHEEIRAYTKLLEEHFDVDVPWHHGDRRWSYVIGPFCIERVYCHTAIDDILYDMLMPHPPTLRIGPIKAWIDVDGDAHFEMDVNLLA